MTAQGLCLRNEKLSCDFRVSAIIVKVHSAYSLTFMRLRGLKACPHPKRIVSCVKISGRHMVEKDKKCVTFLTRSH